MKETAEEGGGGNGRSRSTSRATELWDIWRTCVGMQADRAKCERRQMRKTALFERRSSLSRSCDTGDVDEEERHSQRGQQRLKYKMVWKRATWMQRSFTSQRASRLLRCDVLCRTTWKRCNVEEEDLYPPRSNFFHVGKT